MNDTPKPLSFFDYIHIARRRKWQIIIPLVCSFLIAFGVYKVLPKFYRATATILVQAQAIPEKYIQATVTSTVLDRLNAISQELLSRTRLEKIIEEFNLYPDLRKKAPIEVVVETMSKAVEVTFAKSLQTGSRSEKTQHAFYISYEGGEPRTVMMVTNKLASLIIEENLKVRESQAESTSEFIDKELSRSEELLVKKEQELRNFRERNMGQLPQQLDASIKIMEGLQQQFRRAGDGIRMAEDRATIIQGQLETLTRPQAPVTSSGTPEELISDADDLSGISGRPVPENPIVAQYNQFKRNLNNAQAKYTDSHPDIIDLKRKIANLEPEAKEIIAKQETAAEARRKEIKAQQDRTPSAKRTLSAKASVPLTDPATERLMVQYKEQHNSAILEAKRLGEEEKKLIGQIDLYRKRIEDTPKREQELTNLSRDYDLMKGNYQSLLDKRNQSRMAENLERKQKGEQFKILDPARLPENPVRPDLQRILLIGTFIGLVFGVGLAWYRESVDQCFYTVDDLEGTLNLPVLAEIPSLQKEKT